MHKVLPFIFLIGLVSLTACDAQRPSEAEQTTSDKLSAPPTIQPSLAPVFGNSQTVPYRRFIKEVEQVAIALESSSTMKREFMTLQKQHQLAKDEQTYKDFVRVRLAFEATRDSGLWQLRWAVTDQEPNAKNIWRQWQQLDQPQSQKKVSSILTNESSALATATAECDELSALFSIIARDIGVEEVGLFWPTSNHTVAVWTAKDEQGKNKRVVVPTSQIFLSSKATLGTTEFDPSQQKNIYNYEANDIQPDGRIPTRLAEFMIAQLKKHANLNSAELQTKRNQLSKRIGGS